MSDDRFSKRLLTTILLVATVLVLFGLWMIGPSKTKTSQIQSAKQAAAVVQQWQLCWEKKPEHTGKTGIRQLCLPALVETRTTARIVISYSYSGGQGVMEGTSIDGNEYDGLWKDSTGRGNWHLRFVSPDTAFGWSDDGGKGGKVPNVLEKK